MRYRGGDLVLVIDCSDLDRSAEFWAGVLGYTAEVTPSRRYRSLLPADGSDGDGGGHGGGDGIEILLQRVPEAKHTKKNRLHLDLRTRDLEAEVSRVVGLGATAVSGQAVIEEGWRWHILADPDGNEFCVLQPPARYWPAQAARTGPEEPR
jgi:predicted enzyme related to lactoylglutathione lyase